MPIKSLPNKDGYNQVVNIYPAQWTLVDGNESEQTIPRFQLATQSATSDGDALKLNIGADFSKIENGTEQLLTSDTPMLKFLDTTHFMDNSTPTQKSILSVEAKDVKMENVEEFTAAASEELRFIQGESQWLMNSAGASVSTSGTNTIKLDLNESGADDSKKGSLLLSESGTTLQHGTNISLAATNILDVDASTITIDSTTSITQTVEDSGVASSITHVPTKITMTGPSSSSILIVGENDEDVPVDEISAFATQVTLKATDDDQIILEDNLITLKSSAEVKTLVGDTSSFSVQDDKIESKVGHLDGTVLNDYALESITSNTYINKAKTTTFHTENFLAQIGENNDSFTSFQQLQMSGGSTIIKSTALDVNTEVKVELVSDANNKIELSTTKGLVSNTSTITMSTNGNINTSSQNHTFSGNNSTFIVGDAGLFQVEDSSDTYVNINPATGTTTLYAPSKTEAKVSDSKTFSIVPLSATLLHDNKVLLKTVDNSNVDQNTITIDADGILQKSVAKITNEITTGDQPKVELTTGQIQSTFSGAGSTTDEILTKNSYSLTTSTADYEAATSIDMKVKPTANVETQMKLDSSEFLMKKFTNDADSKVSLLLQNSTDADIYAKAELKHDETDDKYNITVETKQGSLSESASSISSTASSIENVIGNANHFVIKKSDNTDIFKIDTDASSITEIGSTILVRNSDDNTRKLQIDSTSSLLSHDSIITLNQGSNASKVNLDADGVAITSSKILFEEKDDERKKIVLDSDSLLLQMSNTSSHTITSTASTIATSTITEDASTSLTSSVKTGAHTNSQLSLTNSAASLVRTVAASATKATSDKVELKVIDDLDTSSIALGYANDADKTPTITISTTAMTETLNSKTVTAPTITHDAQTSYKIKAGNTDLLTTSDSTAMTVYSDDVKVAVNSDYGTSGVTDGMHVTSSALDMKHSEKILIQQQDGTNNKSRMQLSTDSAVLDVKNNAGTVLSQVSLDTDSIDIQTSSMNIDASNQTYIAKSGTGDDAGFSFKVKDGTNPAVDIFRVHNNGITCTDKKEIEFWYRKTDSQAILNDVLGGLSTDISSLETSIGSAEYSPELLNSQSWLDALTVQKKNALDLSRASNYEEGDSRLALQIYELAKKINFLESNTDDSAVDSVREVIEQFQGVASIGGDAQDMLKNIGRTVTNIRRDLQDLIAQQAILTDSGEQTIDNTINNFGLRDYYFYARQTPTLVEFALSGLSYERQDYIIRAGAIADTLDSGSYSFPTFTGTQSGVEVRMPILYRVMATADHADDAARYSDATTPFVAGYLTLPSAGRDGAVLKVYPDQFSGVEVTADNIHLVLVEASASASDMGTYISSDHTLEAFYDVSFNTYMLVTSGSGTSLSAFIKPTDPLAEGYDSNAPQAYSLKTYRPNYKLIQPRDSAAASVGGLYTYAPPILTGDQTYNTFHDTTFAEVSSIELESDGTMQTYTIQTLIETDSDDVTANTTFKISKGALMFFYLPPESVIDIKFVAGLTMVNQDAFNDYCVRVFKKDNLLANSQVMYLSEASGRVAQITNQELSSLDLEQDDFPGGYHRIGKINFLNKIPANYTAYATDFMHAGFNAANPGQEMHARHYTAVNDLSTSVEFHVRKTFLGIAVFRNETFSNEVYEMPSLKYIEMGEYVQTVSHDHDNDSDANGLHSHDGSETARHTASFDLDTNKLTLVTKPALVPDSGAFSMLVRRGTITDGEFVHDGSLFEVSGSSVSGLEYTITTYKMLYEGAAEASTPNEFNTTNATYEVAAGSLNQIYITQTSNTGLVYYSVLDSTPSGAMTLKKYSLFTETTGTGATDNTFSVTVTDSEKTQIKRYNDVPLYEYAVTTTEDVANGFAYESTDKKMNFIV